MKHFITDRHLVEDFRSVRRERRRLRQQRQALLFLPQRRVVTADVGQQILVLRRFLQKVGRQAMALRYVSLTFAGSSCSFK